MCMFCEAWDSQHGGCTIHNTAPGGCKDFRDIRNSEKIQELHATIAEMQDRIKCLTDENSKLHRELQETALTDNLPYEPIAVAEFLINKTEKYEHNSFMKAFTGNEKGTYNVYGISELRQIAEHLLVYCNNNKDEG